MNSLADKLSLKLSSKVVISRSWIDPLLGMVSVSQIHHQVIFSYILFGFDKPVKQEPLVSGPRNYKVLYSFLCTVKLL